MVRYSATSGEFRLFLAANPGPMDQYDAVCVLQRWRDHVGCLRLMHGTINRQLLRELAGELLSLGVCVIYAERAPGKRLPLFREILQGDLRGMFRLDLQTVKESP